MSLNCDIEIEDKYIIREIQSKMTKEELDFISVIINSIVGIATVITLFFLLWQTRLLKKQIVMSNKESELANKLARNQAYQFRYQLYLEMDKIMIDNPKLKKLISNKKFVELCNEKILTEEDIKNYAFIELVLNLCQLSFYQYKDGLFDSEMNWVKEVVNNPKIKEYWSSGGRCTYRSDFENHIDKILSEIPNNTEIK